MNFLILISLVFLASCGPETSQVGGVGFATNYLLIAVGLRVVSEVFLVIAKHTDNKWDNKIANMFAYILNRLGAISGSVGFGKSKMLK